MQKNLAVWVVNIILIEKRGTGKSMLFCFCCSSFRFTGTCCRRFRNHVVDEWNGKNFDLHNKYASQDVTIKYLFCQYDFRSPKKLCVPITFSKCMQAYIFLRSRYFLLTIFVYFCFTFTYSLVRNKDTSLHSFLETITRLVIK